MNCNTTHYRANSSSVPGDPTSNTVTPRYRDHTVGTESTVAQTQDTMLGVPFYNEPGHTIVALGLLVTAVASSTFRIGAYADRDGVPDTLICDTQEELSGASTAFISKACSIAEDGWLWLAVAVHGAAGSVFVTGNLAYGGVGGSIAPITTRSNGFVRTGITGALPGIWGALADLARPPVFKVDSRPY